MKKWRRRVLIFAITFMLFIGLTACDYAEVEKESEKESSMFIEIEEASYWSVVYHRETKVMYAVSNGSSNRGTFTLLVDENGKPMLYQAEE